MYEGITSTTWVSSDTAANQIAQPYFGEKNKPEPEKKLVYGLKGLADFLHQSVTTAWRLKSSGKYDAAISQRGRCIITDTNKLLELMRLDRSSIQQDYSCYTY